MRLKGVNYDVGRVFQGRMRRQAFDVGVVRRELEIIKDDLHANAVKIQATDMDRVLAAAEHALNLGLEVWISPELYDKSPEETLEYKVKSAAAAEELRKHWPELVLSLGTELTIFMQGILEGESFMQRLANPGFVQALRSGVPNKTLNDYLARACAAVREVFHGRITYASLAEVERVDWSGFDIVGIDLYRSLRNKERYGDLARGYAVHGKPVAVTEFGCCTYQGAEDAGGMGFDIVDWTKRPIALKGDYIYDQEVQARELADQLRVLDGAGIDGAFVFEFSQPSILLSGSESAANALQSIEFDPDIATYSMVKNLPVGRGSTYPDMSWEPKKSFYAVADYYAAH